MERRYYKWFSTHLQRDMELLVFGHAGKPVIFFPTRTARFYDYEDWKVIDAVKSRIEAGIFQIICLDSVDKDSFYNKALHPAERIRQHELFERYILFEILPFIKQQNNNPYIISAGCSLGAYHAVNIAFRHPHLFKKVVAMSGRYDLTMKLEFFDDLFDGFRNEEIYFHTPSHFMPGLSGRQTIKMLKKLDIIIVIGKEDAFLYNNIELSETLSAKDIPHSFFIWEGEAHKAKQWSEMVNLYF